MQQHEKDALLAKGYIYRYGIYWPEFQGMPRPDWMIEQECYLNRNGESRGKKWLGKAEHLKNFITITMGHKECSQPFEWSPNSCQIVEDYVENNWLAIVGHASSGKTRCVAAIAIAEFLMDPENTGCVITSTTIQDAKRRVWADVERCWYDACTFFARFFGLPGQSLEDMEKAMPGELIPSTSMIRFRDLTTGRTDQARGLVLAPSKENEADAGIGRMKGFKSPRMRIFMDEASDMSIRIVDAVESNMVVGCDDFKCVATMNANDMFDTGGNLCEPKDGWGSVDVNNIPEWPTKRGKCRRFDAEFSPNVMLARNGEIAPDEKRWKGLISLAWLEYQKGRLSGPNFQRQYRAQWPTEGTADTMYTVDYLKRNGALSDAKWKEIHHLVGGTDPSWTHGGDRMPLIKLNFGEDEEGRMIIEYHSHEYLDCDMPDDDDRKFYLANLLKQKCESTLNPRKSVQNKHLGMDTTGGGAFFAAIVANQWGNEFLRVSFKETASDKKVSADNSMTGSERFSNRRSEIWAIGMELMLGGQIRGLHRCPELVKQIKDATYEEKNRKIYVEDKPSMKKRLGHSPDLADAFFIAVDVCRQKLGLTPSNKPLKIQPLESQNKGEFDFSNLQKKPNKGFRFSIRRFDTSWRSPH
jgi:hypothetical protein